MEYEELLQAAQSAPYVEDPKTADAAVKAIIKIFESHFDEQRAREISEPLPQPLDYRLYRTGAIEAPGQ